jgi:hypothetical protein
MESERVEAFVLLAAAASDRAFGYTRACSRSPLPRSPPIAIGATARPRSPAAGSNLLASCHDGCTEALMMAHGFTVEQMVELVRAGLAMATVEHMVAGGKAIEVARVRITEAGKRALVSASTVKR